MIKVYVSICCVHLIDWNGIFIGLVGMVYSLIGWNGVLCCLIGQNISIWKHVHLIGWNVSAIFCRITTATTLYLQPICCYCVMKSSTKASQNHCRSGEGWTVCEVGVFLTKISRLSKIRPCMHPLFEEPVMFIPHGYIFRDCRTRASLSFKTGRPSSPWWASSNTIWPCILLPFIVYIWVWWGFDSKPGDSVHVIFHCICY